MKLIKIFITLSVVFVINTAGCAGITAVQNDTQPVVVNELVKTTRSWDGSVLPEYPDVQPEITILRITIPPGTKLETHEHPVINAGVLISGELTVVTTDGKTLHLMPGDPIVELVDKLHYGMNEGNVPADIIVFYAGAEGMPITKK